MDLIFAATELGITFLFLLCLSHALKYDKKSVNFLIFAVLYAIIFENIAVWLTENQIGGYYYNNKFNLFVFDIPLFVVLAWSSIMYTSKYIAESLPIKKYSIPFVASLLVLLIDLSIDAVAIKLNFWTWIGYSFNEGWFGVPANNFIGWLLVSFSFYFFFYLLSEKKFVENTILKYLMITILSYLVYYLAFMPIIFIEKDLGLSKNEQFYVLVFLMILFVSNIKFDKKDAKKLNLKTKLLIYIVRWSFYIFGLIAIIIQRMYLENSLLLLSALLFVIIEIIVMMMEINPFKRKDVY